MATHMATHMGKGAPHSPMRPLAGSTPAIDRHAAGDRPSRAARRAPPGATTTPAQTRGQARPGRARKARPFALDHSGSSYTDSRDQWGSAEGITTHASIPLEAAGSRRVNHEVRADPRTKRAHASSRGPVLDPISGPQDPRRLAPGIAQRDASLAASGRTESPTSSSRAALRTNATAVCGSTLTTTRVATLWSGVCTSTSRGTSL